MLERYAQIVAKGWDGYKHRDGYLCTQFLEGIRERSQIQAASFAQMRSLRKGFLALPPIRGCIVLIHISLTYYDYFHATKGGALFVESIYLRSAKNRPKANHIKHYPREVLVSNRAY